MSFSIDLWDNYEAVFSRYQRRKKEFKEFYDIIYKKLLIETEYSKSISGLSEYPLNTLTESDLSSILETFKNKISNYNLALVKDWINPLKVEIVEPLKEIIKDHKALGLKYDENYRKNQKNYNEMIEKLEKIKNKYTVLSKSAEEQKIKIDQIKFQNLTNDQKAKIKFKAESVFTDLKEAENNYTKFIEAINDSREKYIENIKICLSEFENLEESYVSQIKELLKRYLHIEITCKKSQIIDSEIIVKALDCFQPKHDIRKFIELKKNPYSFPAKHEFEPYIPEMTIKKPRKSSGGILDYAFSLFSHKVSSSDETIHTRLNTYVSNAWEGKNLTLDDKNDFIIQMKEKRFRKHLFTLLNNFRIKGIFNLSSEAYLIIGDLLSIILDELSLVRDPEGFRSVLILSQTFYKTEGSLNIYLQSNIDKHSIWNLVEYWEELLKYSINEEYTSIQNLQSVSNDIAEEVKKRHQNIVFGQLISFQFNIQNFNVSKDKIKDIIFKFAQMYELKEEYIGTIIANLDSMKVEEKKTVEIKEKKFLDSKERREMNKSIDLRDVGNLSREESRKTKSERIFKLTKDKTDHLVHPLEK